MIVSVDVHQLEKVVKEIITFIEGEHEVADNKKIEEIKEKYRKPRLRKIFPNIPGRELTDDEAIDILKEIAREGWRSTWRDTRWNTWLSRAKSLRQACNSAKQNAGGNGRVNLELNDIQLLRWHNDDWDQLIDTYGE